MWSLLETIIREKIVKYLQVNKIMKDSQNSLRNKRFCLTNLLDFFDELFNETKAVDITWFPESFRHCPT